VAAEAADEPSTFVVRLTRRASADMMAAWDHQSLAAGENHADQWQQGLERAISQLAQMPGIHPVAEEESRLFGFTVRKMLYRRTRSRRGAPAHLVYFRVLPKGDDPATVLIVHLRHGAQAPLSGEEARSIAEAE
jgi:plasmid stabilization system protein ParE